MAQYNVNLAFTADTGKAKAQLQDLQRQLTNLINTPQAKLNLEGDIQGAIRATAELKTHLQAATNIKTGNLDFAKLNKSITASGNSLSEYAAKLQSLGPAGQQAFMTLAQSVAQAEIPIRRSNEALDKLWMTLQNTARWQISSSILHGFMGAVQSAYGYAQDLNGSLNDIRIVTGQNADQMAKFAKEANKAAKALSTTTTQYTKASLIYYQQGLSAKEVKDRTDITVKMANVTRTSAEDVSDQMTAVWNNFYDGSKSLEHYADVMTALGAATASSTDEISEGLNKFAAVAETVGLSYEYAASALATVTATTRESADIVGNAFKTLFARIQGLKLGETLDDGTTLNKYSQALDSVGIDIKAVNGEMKDMDTILNELGAKWNTLGKDQQIALAQTVAGVRQYTQLIALMDNWDYFQENLGVANTSTGALDKQAEIYAESWEATQDRVRAAAESIYEKLVNDEFFIDLLNGFEKILSFVDNLIDGLGGLKGVLLTLGSILTRVFSDKLSQTLTNLVYNIKMSTKAGRESIQKERTSELNKMSSMIVKDPEDPVQRAQAHALKTQIDLQTKLTEAADKMNETELAINQTLLDRIKILQDQHVKSTQNLVQIKEQVGDLQFQARVQLGTPAAMTEFGNQSKVLQKTVAAKELVGHLRGSVNSSGESDKNTSAAFARLTLEAKKLNNVKFTSLIQGLKKAGKEASLTEDDLAMLANQLLEIEEQSKTAMVDLVGDNEDDQKAMQATVDQLTKKYEQQAAAARTVHQETREIGSSVKDFSDNVDNSKGKQQDWATNLVATAGAITTVTSSLQSAVGLISVWNNEDMTAGEKLLTTFTTLATVVPMLITAFTGLNLQQLAGAAAAISHALGLSTEAVAAKVAAGATVSFGAALWSVLWPIGLVMAAIAALVAIVWVVSKGMEMLNNAYNADAIAAEEAAEKAQELAEAYREVKQAYDELKESLADYQNAQNAIDELKKGTDEWREAIQEANQQVMQLVDTYPELAAYVTNTEGRLTISDEGMRAVKEQYAQRTNALYNMSLDANLDAKKAQSKADRTSMIRNNLSFMSSDESSAAMWIGGLGSAVALAIDASQESSANAALSAISEAYMKDGNAIFGDFENTLETLNITDEKLVERLIENKDAIQDLVTVEKQNLEYAKLVQQQKVDNLLASQGFSSEHYNANIQNLARKRYEKEVANKKATDYNINDWTYQKWYTLGIATGGTDEGERVAKEYANLMGYEDFDVTNFKGDRIKFEHTVDGETQKGEITYAAMQKALAENAVGSEKAILQYAQRLTNAIVTLETVGTKEADALASFLEEGDLSYVDPEAWNELKEGNLKAIFPEGTDVEQVAKDFGYDSVAALQRAVAEAPYNAEQALANIARRTAEEVNAIFNENAAALGTTTEALEAYAAHLIDTNEGLEDNKKMAALAAVEHFKLARGLNKLQEVFEENAEILKEADENSIDYYEALGKVAEAVEETFGLNVSADFIKENLEDIEKMANGDEKALARLRKEVNKDFILNLNISEDNKNALETELAYLSSIAENSPIGTQLTLDNSNAIAAINEALYTGAATIDDIEAMFNNANLQMPEYHTTTIPGDAVKSHSTTTSTFTGPLGISWTQTAESDTVTTTDRVVPYFGDSAPTVNETTGQINYGSSKPMAVKSTGNLNSLGSSLDYKGEEAADSGNEKELDRYHYISRALAELEKDYDAISKARERAFGVDKLALYDREIAKMEEVQGMLQKYADEAKAYYDQDRAALLGAGYGIKLDSEGNITNYDEVFAKHGQSDEFEELISNYEDSLDTWKEKLQEVIDKRNELLDMKLEKIQYKIDLSIKVDDQSQQYLDFLIEMADDPLTDAAEKLGYLTAKIQSSSLAAEKLGENLRAALQETGWDNAEIDQLLKGENIEQLLASNELTEKQVDILEQYRDQLYTTTQMMMTWADDIKDTVIEAFDEMSAAFDESAAKLDHYNTILTTYENIIDLVGKDTLGISDEVMAQLSQAQVDNAVAQLNVNREAHELNKKALEDLRNSYNENWSEDAKKAWNEAIEHAEEKVRESEATLFSSWEEALQAAAEAFEKAVKTAVNAFEKAMSGIHGSFDAMQTAYDQQTRLNERYLEDYEKIYQLSKLNRQVQNSIDDTDNVKAKKVLAGLQEEIVALSESDAEISAYQVEHLQKEYDLKMALIALEEAQNAKSQVRMQRDSEGNWSYVYTADESKVDDAQQNYEDKLFALQEYTQEYIKENSNALMQLQQEYADAMANIKRENYATQEEYEEALAETTAFYEKMMNYHLDEIGLATTDAKELYEQDWSAYNRTTGYKISKDGEWILSFNQTTLAITGNYDSISDYQTKFKDASTAMIDALSDAYGQWKTNVDTAMVAAGTSTDKFAGQVEADTKSIQENTELIVGSLESIGTTAYDTFSDVVEAASGQYNEYSKWIATYIAKNAELIASLNAVIQKKAEAAAAINKETVETPGNEVDNITGDLSGGDDGGGGSGDSDYSYDFKNAQYYDETDSEFYDTALSLNTEQLKKVKRDASVGNSYTYTDDEGILHLLDDDEVKAALTGAGLAHLYTEKEGPSPTTPSEDEGRNIAVSGYYYDETDGELYPDSRILLTYDELEKMKREPSWGNSYAIKSKGVWYTFDDDVIEGVLKSYGLPFTTSGGYQKAVGQNYAPGDELEVKTDTFAYANYDYGDASIGISKGTKFKVADVASYEGRTGDPVYWYRLPDSYTTGAGPMWMIQSARTLKLASMDTGGYTGAWGTSGRLALLHQKELVLNPEDTVNMLQAVDIVRKIVRVIDLNAANAANAFGMLTASTASNNNQVIEQEVTIHAEFPNATNHTEIEEAFNSLINRASQFANRKK